MKLMILLTVACMVGMAVAGTEETAKEEKAGIRVSLVVPDGSWSVAITEAREVDGNVWVLAQLTKAPGMAIMALRTVTASIDLDPGARPVRVLVAGKTWGWPSKEAYDFLNDLPDAAREKLLKTFRAGKKLYPKG